MEGVKIDRHRVIYLEKIKKQSRTESLFWVITSYAQVSKTFCLGGMAFYATLNNISVISCRAVLMVDETRVPGENHQPAANH